MTPLLAPRHIMNIIFFHFPSNPNKATNLYKVTSKIFFEFMRNMSHILSQHAFYLCDSKDADQLCSKSFKDSAIHFFLNTKFQAFNLLLWLYRPLCVKPGQRLLSRGSNIPGLRDNTGKIDRSVNVNRSVHWLLVILVYRENRHFV